MAIAQPTEGVRRQPVRRRKSHENSRLGEARRAGISNEAGGRRAATLAHDNTRCCSGLFHPTLAKPSSHNGKVTPWKDEGMATTTPESWFVYNTKDSSVSAILLRNRFRFYDEIQPGRHVWNGSPCRQQSKITKTRVVEAPLPDEYNLYPHSRDEHLHP